jgi:hypothetical protein
MFKHFILEFWDNSIETAAMQLAKYLDESQGKAILVSSVGKVVNGTFMIDAVFKTDQGDQ